MAQVAPSVASRAESSNAADAQVTGQLIVKPSDLPPHLQLKHRITQSLIDLGSTFLTDYADPSTDYDPFEPKKRIVADISDTKGAAIDNSAVSAVAKLNKAAHRAFGTVGDYLKYDYSEEFGPLRKRCILEVTRNDGLKRVYSTKPEFARKSEAKTKVATIAIENGAIDFILYGNDPRGKGYSLAPVNGPVHTVEDEAGESLLDINTVPTQESAASGSNPTEVVDSDGFIALIEQCCQEWRAGRIRPVYYFTSDSKSPDHGCALKINLTDHISRAYSVLPTFKNPDSAKAAVAQLAVEQDVIEFIKHGDGQLEPLPQSAEYELPENITAAAAAAEVQTKEGEKKKRRKEKIDPELLASKIMTVASFFDTLPQPLPEPVGVKTAEDTNPVAWLHGVLQRHRASHFFVTHSWTIDPKLGLHGCVMRIQQGSGDSRTYIVEPVFAKRQDAKIAASLEAISKGISEWIRSAAVPAQEKLTQELRDKAREVLVPAIQGSMQSLNPPQQPEWISIPQHHMYGCTLTVRLDATSYRKYSVPPEHLSRLDAKFAVTLLAVEKGVLEFIRFRGLNSPADFDREAYAMSFRFKQPGPFQQFNKSGNRQPVNRFEPNGRGRSHRDLSGVPRAPAAMLSQPTSRGNFHNDHSRSQNARGTNRGGHSNGADRWSGHGRRNSYEPRDPSISRSQDAMGQYNGPDSYDRGLYYDSVNEAGFYNSHSYETRPAHEGNNRYPRPRSSEYQQGYHDPDYPYPSDREPSQNYDDRDYPPYSSSSYDDRDYPPTPSTPRASYYPPPQKHASLIPTSYGPSLNYSSSDDYYTAPHPAPPADGPYDSGMYHESTADREPPMHPDGYYSHSDYVPDPSRDPHDYAPRARDPYPPPPPAMYVRSPDHISPTIEPSALPFTSQSHHRNQNRRRPSSGAHGQANGALADMSSRSHYGDEAGLESGEIVETESSRADVESSLRDKAKASRKRSFSGRTDTEDSGAGRQWQKRARTTDSEVSIKPTPSASSKPAHQTEPPALTAPRPQLQQPLSPPQPHPAAEASPSEPPPAPHPSTTDVSQHQAPPSFQKPPPDPRAIPSSSPPFFKAKTKPALTLLFEFCATHEEPIPELHSELVPRSDSGGVQEHKVWMIMGKEKLELPTAFPTLSAGQEKLASLVLARLKKKYASTSSTG